MLALHVALGRDTVGGACLGAGFHVQRAHTYHTCWTALKRSDVVAVLGETCMAATLAVSTCHACSMRDRSQFCQVAVLRLYRARLVQRLLVIREPSAQFP